MPPECISNDVVRRINPETELSTVTNPTEPRKRMKPSKAVITGAAIAGLITGSLAVRAYAASTADHAGVSSQTLAEAEKGKHTWRFTVTTTNSTTKDSIPKRSRS
jgi:hypothetical protein